jgi:hypothetical protein
MNLYVGGVFSDARTNAKNNNIVRKLNTEQRFSIQITKVLSN